MHSNPRKHTYQVGDLLGGFGFKTKNHRNNEYYKRLAMVVKTIPSSREWNGERLVLQWLDTGAVTSFRVQGWWSVYDVSNARIWIVSESQVAGELPRHPRAAWNEAALRASKIPGDYQNFTRA